MSAEARSLCHSPSLNHSQHHDQRATRKVHGQTKLKNRIIESLAAQGFRIKNGTILPPSALTKEKVRSLHATAVHHKRECAKEGLWRKEHWLLSRIASGVEVIPEAVAPKLIAVLPDSQEELLFRYVSLHWSVPVSSGYGRRLRFIVVDESNGKVMGIIGLGDPVIALSPRDSWIGWHQRAREKRLRYVMDAFVLGAVPPYSYLLCGKLVAMLVASDTIRKAFRKKYDGTTALIRRTEHDGRLAMITTSSALGRSSIYNRLRYRDRTLYQRVGFTGGSGEFHFSNGLYHDIFEFAAKHCTATYRRSRWGKGFRNRREVLKKVLPLIGLPRNWLFHGIAREVFVIPLAHNTREFLRGEHSRLNSYRQTEQEIAEFFRERWFLPRAARDQTFRSFDSNSYRLWS